MGQDRPMFIFTTNTANSHDNAQAASPNRRRLRKTSTPKRTTFRRKELRNVGRLLDSDSGSEAESSSSSSNKESSSGSSDSDDEEDEDDEYDDEEEVEDTSSSSSSSSSSDSESDVPMQTINDTRGAEGSASVTDTRTFGGEASSRKRPRDGEDKTGRKHGNNCRILAQRISWFLLAHHVVLEIYLEIAHHSNSCPRERLVVSIN